MAASSKFDLSSSCPDGPTYPNGQRGPYATASLERSASFREGMESRISSAPSLSRSSLTQAQGDFVNLVHSLISDFKPVFADQKLLRSGEIRRAINSVIGSSSEESSASIGARYPPSTVEELRRAKSSLGGNLSKARERGRYFDDAIQKIDKLYPPPRKRSRGDTLSSDQSNILVSGGTIPKSGPQSHLNANGLELGVSKVEERTKNAIQNRKFRSPILETQIDGRDGSGIRPSGSVERDKDVAGIINGGQVMSEEKARGVVKRKRSAIKSDASTSADLTRSAEADREVKRGMQQKLGSDARPRVASVHGFRSGPVPAGTAGAKSEFSSQQDGPAPRSLPRNDQDSGPLPNSRRDRLSVFDKQGGTPKAVNKSNSREDSCAASPASSTRVNPSARGPRSNSASLSKGTLNINHSQANSDDGERTNCINKLVSVGGATNRKRLTRAPSPSSPVGQWGERSQKRTARRSNLIPITSSHDDTPLSNSVENANNVSRTKSGNSTGLSESEESGVAENKISKDKGKRCGEIEENNRQNGQKMATVVLPSRKNKTAADDDNGDGARRQGRIARGFASKWSEAPASIAKLDNSAITKQRSARTEERNESKPGRPPTKKLSERKSYMRPRHSVNTIPLELPGDSDDDSEELLAAANSVFSPTFASSGDFWPYVEPVFRFLSEEDIAFLNQQIHLINESSSSRHVAGDDSQDFKSNLEYVSQPSTPAGGSRDDHGALSNGTSLSVFQTDTSISRQIEDIEPFMEQLIQGVGAQRGVSICQTLLSAIIEEDEVESFNYGNSKGEEYSHDAFEVEGDGTSQYSYMQSLITMQAGDRGPNGFKGDAGWRYHDELIREKPVSNGVLPEVATQYSQMCIDDRILLELSELGLYPEPVPDLTQSGDEDIIEGISKLEEMLHEQVSKKKDLLLKLEKVVTAARETQPRELVRVAMDRLVGRAYGKYLEYCGPKNSNRVGKHGALAFVRRTLVRCRKFEQTGTSCFDEPPFRDMFISGPSYGSNAKCIYTSADFICGVMSKQDQAANTSDKNSDTSRSLSHLSEQSLAREDTWSNRVKKREMLLDDVVGSIAGTSSLRASSGLGTSLISGTKGKRSDRDREVKGQNRDSVRNGVPKIGRPSLSNLKGERKNKTKPKQRTTQLSAEAPATTAMPSGPKSRETGGGRNDKKDDLAPNASSGVVPNVANDGEAVDLSSLQLPEIDVADLVGQGQDIGSWLSIDDEVLQDHDFVGLEIPMDDLSDVLR
ncbi:uncharacterized protein LOC109724063 isoform X2 [Ananas comosus]|uniref:Uncharacterized protein LOC109724063 isoform X2 n=2 Tax=Ananas comosus TaxID=4615 RepID=A0A6P5GI18_ANACO|nr:uncharacterized protein LOC109724063 isoform X2 [Ananas comosus]CAD1841913.1 unnamed protein product [Ananas comosus var. bracteatus]